MLLLSTRPDNRSLINLAGHLLQETPSKVQEAVELTGIFRAEKSSWDVCLRVSNMLLAQGQINQAKELIAEIDSAEYFQQAASAGQVNLLFSVLIRTDQGDVSFFLLESANMAERFSVFDDIDIRLRVANALLAQGQIDQAKELIAEIDSAEYFQQAASAGQVNLLFNVLIRTDQGDVSFFLLKLANMAERFSVFDDMDIRLRVANALLAQGQIDQAKELIAEINSAEYFQQAASAGQVNLLFSVLIRTDQGDVSFFLLESANMAERFSVFDDIDIRLRVANALLAQGQIDQAKELIAEINSAEYFQQAASAGQVNLLFSVLIRTDQGDVSFFLLESANMAERFSVFDDIDIRLRVANALLAQGQIDQAKELIAEINSAEYFQQAASAGQVNLLFNVLVYAQRSNEIVRLLEDVKVIRLIGGEALIDLKLDIGRKLIMQGQRYTAKKILISINPDKLTNKDHFDALGLLYIHLSMFDKASSVFNVAEKKKCIHPDLFTHMAILFFCLGKMDKASKYIDEQIQSSRRTPTNLLWKAKLLNYSGQHVKALYWIDVLLSKYSSNPVWRCFGLVEKGNFLRSLGKYEEANICYQKAQSTNHGVTFWLWIAHFENAMTLIYLNKAEAALASALKGCSYKSPIYNEKYNPCAILYHYLLYRQNRSKEFFILPEKWADNAMLWPFSSMQSYKKWMLLLTALVLNERRKPNAANYKFLGAECCSIGLFSKNTFDHRLFLKLYNL